MPAKAKLFDNKATEIGDFGVAARNAVSWNAHGNRAQKNLMSSLADKPQ